MNLTRLWGVVSALLVLVILAGGWFLGVSPQLNRAATANEQLVQVQSGNELQRLTLAGLQQLEEQRPELEAQLADGRQAIPALAQFPPLLQELSDLAGASGVTLSNFSAQPAQSFVPAEQYAEIVPAGLDPATFITIPLRIEVEGSFGQVLDLVQRVQAANRYLLVSDLRVARPAAEDEAGLVTGTMSGLVFVLLDAPLQPGEELDDAPVDPELDASN